jgi:hypothetical protein
VTLTLAQLQALAASVGFPDPALAAAVAMAESGGNTCAQGDPNTGVHACSGPNGTSTSFGLWQIHTPTSPQFDAARLVQDPQYNARAAYAISSGGQRWSPWTTYNTGAYRQFYQPAVYIRPPAPTPGTGIGGALLGAAAIAAAGGYAAHAMRRAHA